MNTIFMNSKSSKTSDTYRLLLNLTEKKYWRKVINMYNDNIKFKTSMVMSNLFNYRDAYIHVKAAITVPNTAAAAAAQNNTNKKVIFKTGAPFTSCIT